MCMSVHFDGRSQMFMDGHGITYLIFIDICSARSTLMAICSGRSIFIEHLFQDEPRLTVTDNGRGMEADELRNMVSFGYAFVQTCPPIW